MTYKKYIFIATLIIGVMISLSVKCGSTTCTALAAISPQKQAVQQDKYFETYNLLFIKYSF